MESNQENNTVETVEKVEAVQPQSTENVAKQEPETQEQINWRKFRQQREIERKQKEEAERKAKQKEEEAAALKAAMDAILSKQTPTPSYQSQSGYEEEETEDQRIDKKVRAVLEAEKRKVDEERRQREQAELPNKLASTYKDFNQVCSSDNLDYLEYHYPEVASAFKHMPDGFDKWASVYQAVKRFVPNTDSKKEQQKAEKNFNKPQSMAVSGVTQTSDGAPMMLDEKRRADNWSRMQRVMKGGR